MSRQDGHSPEKRVAIQNVKLAEISKLFAELFPSSWMVGADAERGKTLRKVWGMSIEGLFDEQINYGINQIAKAATPFQKFPPNPQEFRALCQCFKMPEKKEPLQIARVLSPAELAEREAKSAETIRNFKQELKIMTIKQEEARKIQEAEEKKKGDDYHATLMRLESELKAKARELVSDQKISENIPHQNRGENNGGTNT